MSFLWRPRSSSFGNGPAAKLARVSTVAALAPRYRITAFNRRRARTSRFNVAGSSRNYASRAVRELPLYAPRSTASGGR